MSFNTREVSIEVQNRETTVTVSPPDFLGGLKMLVELDSSFLTSESVEEELTLGEIEEQMEIVVDATTDLPPSLIEQLPADALARLFEASEQAMAAQAKESARRLEQRMMLPDDGLVLPGGETTKLRGVAEPMPAPMGDPSPLLEVPGVSEKTADQLEQAGFTTVQDLRKATVGDIRSVDGISQAFASRIKHEVGEVEH